MNKSLRQLIKSQRLEYGLSQAHVAERAGISASYLCKLENSTKREPSCFVLANLLAALDLYDEIYKL